MKGYTMSIKDTFNDIRLKANQAALIELQSYVGKKLPKGLVIVSGALGISLYSGDDIIISLYNEKLDRLPKDTSKAMQAAQLYREKFDVVFQVSGELH